MVRLRELLDNLNQKRTQCLSHKSFVLAIKCRHKLISAELCVFSLVIFIKKCNFDGYIGSTGLIEAKLQTDKVKCLFKLFRFDWVKFQVHSNVPAKKVIQMKQEVVSTLTSAQMLQFVVERNVSYVQTCSHFISARVSLDMRVKTVRLLKQQVHLKCVFSPVCMYCVKRQ